MKRVLLGVISVILVLASVFGIFASYNGLEDVPSIQRSKNLQAADIEDAIDLIEENLDKQSGDEPDDIDLPDETEEPEPTPTPTPTPTPAPTPTPTAKPQANSGSTDIAALQSECNKWQTTLSSKQNVLAGCQAKYDAAANKVSSDKTALSAAQAKLSSAQSKLNSLPSLSKAESAYNSWSALNQKYNSAEYQALPDDFSVKRDTKYDMDNAWSAYQSALGGYSSLDELRNAYNPANSAVNAAKAEVDKAQQQLNTDQQALDTAKSNLDYANSEVNYSKDQLEIAQAALAKASGSAPDNSSKNDTKKNDKDDEPKPEDIDVPDEIEEPDDDAEPNDIVKANLEVLLANEDIASRVVDESDAQEVVDAAREYLDETSANVEKELGLREKLYTALKFLSFAGAAAGLIGIILTIVPKKFLFAVSIILSALTVLGAIAVNTYGLMGGYFNFVYSRANGGGGGNLQLLALLAILIASVAALIIAIICLSAFKKALRMRKLKQQVAQMNAKTARNRL